ncbi:MAG: hypothetical protein IPL83_01930 [Bdellovibrionales bacterium]|nr:hypothetical protein [Bdellovibrionales bacterium]
MSVWKLEQLQILIMIKELVILSVRLKVLCTGLSLNFQRMLVSLSLLGCRWPRKCSLSPNRMLCVNFEGRTMCLFGSYFWNVFLWPSVFFTATQICFASSPSKPSSNTLGKPTTERLISRFEVKAFTFQTLSAREGSILYSHDPARMRWELAIRRVEKDKNGEMEIASSLRQVGRRAFPIVLKSLAGWGSEGHHFREVLDRALRDYNRNKRGRRKQSLQISQESVAVASYYLGGKNRITKEFYLFVDYDSSGINLWVVSRSGMGNEKFEGGTLESSRTSRQFDKIQTSPEEGQAEKRQAAGFADSVLARLVGKYLVNSGRDQIRLVLHLQDITSDRNGGIELKAGIGLAGGGIQNIDFGPLTSAGEFYDTYKTYYNEERLKKRQRNLGFVEHESMVYVGKLDFGGRNQLTKRFYLIVEWPTAEIKTWIVSKKDSGVEKIEKVYLRKLLDGCQEFLSNENE